MALPHGPLVSTPTEPDVESEEDKHAAMTRYADLILGKLVKHLDELGIRENTLIVWTTDNGTSGKLSNSLNGQKVKGRKGKSSEVCVNVPFIVNMPGSVPAGKESEALVDLTDMMSTFADFASAKPDDSYVYDGVSAKAVFLGESAKSEREFVMAMGGGTAVLTENGVENVYYFRDRVIGNERYKLWVNHLRQPAKLFDIKADLLEKKDLIRSPDLKPVVDELLGYALAMPEKDEDPKYRKIAVQKGDREVHAYSQIHKIGSPDFKEGSTWKAGKKPQGK